MLVLRCHQILSEFLAKNHLPRMSYQSRLSANDKDENEINLMLMLRCHQLLSEFLAKGHLPNAMSDTSVS
jgi:hypothetical protein